MFYPEFEVLAIYLIVIAVLLLRAGRPVRKAGGMKRGAALGRARAAIAALGARAAGSRRPTTPA